MIKKVLSFFVLTSLCFSLFAEDEAVPYSKDEFPQWAINARRTEIVTLGSLPFTTILASLLYKFWDTDTFISSDKDVRVFATAASLSVGVGLSDLVICLVNQKNLEKCQKKELEQNTINVTPVEPEKEGPPESWYQVKDGLDEQKEGEE